MLGKTFDCGNENMTALSDCKYCVHKYRRSRYQNIPVARQFPINMISSDWRHLMSSVVWTGCAACGACLLPEKKKERKRMKEARNNDADLSACNVAEGEPGFRWPCTRIWNFPRYVDGGAARAMRASGGDEGGDGEEDRDEGQCLHKTTRGYRLSVLDCRGVCYAGCASRGYVPCLTSCDSNSTQTLLSASAIPLSFAAHCVLSLPLYKVSGSRRPPIIDCLLKRAIASETSQYYWNYCKI